MSEKQSPETFRHIEQPYKNPESKLEEKDYQRTLYRESNIGDTYLLWRDKILPLKHFEGSPHSDMTPKSLATFWFDEPKVFSKNNFQILLKTDLNKWQNRPNYYGKGKMLFKARGSISSGPMHAGQGPSMNSMLEYYIGDSIPLEQLQIFRRNETSTETKAIFAGLAKISELIKQGIPVKASEFSIMFVDSEDKDIKEAYKLISKISDEGLSEEWTRKTMPFDAPLEERQKSYEARKNQINSILNDDKEIQNIQHFYTWLQQLPAFDHWADQVSDLDNNADWDIDIDPSTKQIVKKLRTIK